MNKEYCIITKTDPQNFYCESDFDKLAKKGWFLLSVIGNDKYEKYYFEKITKERKPLNPGLK